MREHDRRRIAKDGRLLNLLGYVAAAVMCYWQFSPAELTGSFSVEATETKVGGPLSERHVALGIPEGNPSGLL